MIDRFVRKLRNAAPLTPKDVEALGRLAQSVRRIEGRGDIIVEGGEPRSLFLIVEGWACRYRLLENGKRQIVSILVPGDLCEPFGVLPRFIDHSLGALTPVAIAAMSLQEVGHAARESTRIDEALWWDLLVAWSIEREHVVSLGRRSASERVGHLVCELHLRLDMVGLVEELAYDMPITQADLSDVLGLSTVHVNRSLQELRKAGLISLRGRRLTIHDLGRLREFSFFDADYLRTEVAASLAADAADRAPVEKQ